MDLSTVNLTDFTRNAQILWLKGAEEFPMVMRKSGIVREISIPNNTGDTREFSEIDLEQYARIKAEREQAQFAKVQQGYSKVGTLYRIAFAEAITYEMRTRGKNPEIIAKLTNLLPTAMNRMELDLQHRFTFAHSTTMTDMDGRTVDLTVGDGLAFASTAHLVRGSAATFRNILSGNTAFSRSSLEAMEKMRIENHINQFGQKVPVMDDIIWTTDNPNTINTVREVLQATASTESEKNAGVPNVYRGKYRHVILNRVATDANGNVDSTKVAYWGVVSSRESSFFLGVHEEPHVIPPKAGSNAEDNLTDDWYFNVRAGYMIVIPSANWGGISKGDGS
jgi:hypothetical protein